MKKRLLSILLAAVMVLSAEVVDRAWAVEDRLPADDPCDGFEWLNISTGQMPFMYNHGMLFDDARQMSTDLAKASVIIADTAYKGKDAIATLMKNMGYTPLDNSTSYERETSIYFNDVVAFTVAYCDVTYQGEAYRLYCVPIRGTAANSEWYSNFNIGTSGEHEGFHKAAKEVYNKITFELMNDTYDAAHSIVWLTGHSRGAAVSNVVAGMLNENDRCCMPEHIFAYTFACPSVSKNSVAYENIYNFNNPGDMITAVPLEDWGYDRNGTTIELPLSQIDNLRHRFRAEQGKKYCSATSTTDYVTILSSAIPTENSAQEPAKKLMLLLAGYALGGRTETSIWDIVAYSGYTIASSELSDIIKAATSIPGLSSKLAELTGVDAGVIAFANEYLQTVQAMTEEQFAQFRADHASDVSALEKAAAITINSVDVFAVARQIVQSRIAECEKLTDVVAAVTALLMDSNGNLLAAITHGHQTETYIYWINSMFGGYKGWYNNTSVTAVSIPRTRTISYGAFYGCSNLSNVDISDRVSRIADSAFYQCSSLTSIVIPDTVKSIGKYAFSWCKNLKEVTLPISAEYAVFETDAATSQSSFALCSKVQKITYTVGDGSVFVPESSKYMCTLPSAASNMLVTVVYEEGITEIPACALYVYNRYCGALVSVTLPSTVKKIGAYAFSNCSSLTNITIPEGVESIGAGAFSGCSSLNEISLPTLKEIADSTFYQCSSLTSIVIPDTVKSIGKYAFSWCKNLKEVTLPISAEYAVFETDAATSQSSFALCSKVQKITYTVGDGSVFVPESSKYMCTLPSAASNMLVTVVYEEGITEIPACALYVYNRYCGALVSVTLPSTVKKIGASAFYGCSALKDVYYGGYGADWATVDGTDYVPAGATVHFKDNLYGKGECGDNANWIMTLDGTLTISGTGVIIGASWYEARLQVKNAVIGDGVTSIGLYAFSGCENMASVTIPGSVTSIGVYAFERCKALINVAIPDSVTQLGTGAFLDCASLTSVAIPSGVTAIENNTFSNCSSLSNVSIPSSVESIGDWAFSSCTSLTAVTIPDSVTDIGTYTFFGCGSLTDVTIPKSVTSIDEWAFYGCESLTSVTIPVSVTSIGESAFYACSRMADVYYKGTAADWAKITIEEGNEDLTNATLHCAKSAPTAPVVKIGNSAASGKPMLTWNAVEGATSYRIYRSTAKGSGYSLLGTTTATSYTNTGAKAGTTYYYRVKACNDAGLSPYSNIVSGQVKSVTPKPSAPVVKIGNSSTSGKPMLTWNAVSGATSYKVYRATSQKGTYSLLGTVTATSYTNTGAKAGVTYYYKVKAVNSAGESAYSNVVSGKTTVTTLTMGHSASSGKPMLTWKAVSGAASYKVYRATAKNGAYSVINTTKALTYTNVGAALGTTYYYKVEALNAAGKSMGFSAVVEGKVAPVLAVGYSSVSGKPQLTWKSIPGATEYQVYRSTQQNSGYTKINTTTSTSYVNTGAKAGTTYYYRIVAVKGTAVSDFSNIVSARPGK